MPELPEVETIIRTLEVQIGHAMITSVEFLYDKLIHNVSVEEFKQRVALQRILAYKRKGKYLIFELEQDVICCHLRMEGRFYIYNSVDFIESKHIHLIFHLEDGRLLCYHDTRKFGRFYLYKKGKPLLCLQTLGVEPWDEALSATFLHQITQHKQVTLKSFLLDQTYITGIGNIYANEICFVMRLDPQIPVSFLSLSQCKELIDAIRMILEKAIQSGGTTIRSYTSSLGVSGRFQLQLEVYGKENEPCLVCGTLIKKRKLQGRGTFFCETCQVRGDER